MPIRYVGKIIVILLVGFLCLAVVERTEAQCAMCQASVSSSAESDEVGRGLNRGILYLLSIPYLLFMGFAVTIYRSIRRNRHLRLNADIKHAGYNRYYS